MQEFYTQGWISLAITAKFAVIKISILELVPVFENKFLAGEKKFPGFWSHVMHHWKVDL